LFDELPLGWATSREATSLGWSADLWVGSGWFWSYPKKL